MKAFKDIQGREWQVTVSVTAIKRVKGLTGVDLLEVLDGSLIQRLIGDPVLLVDVLYAVCKPQADERSITDEQFGEAMAGDAIDTATAALLDEIVSFCPSPRDRANLGRILKAANEVMDKARDRIEAKLNSGELERAAEEALRQTLGDLSGDAPASSESIQAT